VLTPLQRHAATQQNAALVEEMAVFKLDL